MFSWFLRRRTRRNNDRAPGELLNPLITKKDDPVYDTDDSIYVYPPKLTLRSLMAATDNFSAKNELGVRDGPREIRGELGPVFKGKLEDGQVVAVRRLPGNCYCRSLQVDEQLIDKLLRAARLNHDNIVQLLGVCLGEREKLLVYEYLPNASLDTILFDTERRRRHLNLEKRYSIIRGIARGLLYLHEESGLGINHNGFFLRPSKILLDDDMNPKILFAGISPPDTDGSRMAWSCNITRYMAPEWFLTGRLYTKSDMFSFGVILIEMVMGRQMYPGCWDDKKNQNGLSYVWDKWNSRSIADIAEASLGHHYPHNEMRKCVHIGLLCLQHDPKLRPDASAVMQALDTSCLTSLPTPMPFGSYGVRSMA